LPYHILPVVYTPLASEDYYSVKIFDVSVNGASIGPLLAKHTIVDTGTPNPNLPDAAYANLKATFIALCSKTNLVGICPGTLSNGTDSTLFDQTCYPITEAEMKLFPTITFNMPGVALKYTPEMYLTPQYYCTAPGMDQMHCNCLDESLEGLISFLFFLIYYRHRWAWPVAGRRLARDRSAAAPELRHRV
jgi:hypothetical protein